MSKTVDALGQLCPIPVIKAKKALREADDVTILVDNEISAQNLEKMAKQLGYAYSTDKKDGQYHVHIEKTGEASAEQLDAYEMDEQDIKEAAAHHKDQSYVVAISTDRMGQGDDELGKQLIKGFIYALTEQDVLPDKILFYNGGVKLTTEGSESLEDLKSLEERGVEIQSCGLCLNFFGLTEKLQVGSITNLYAVLEQLRQANRVVRP